MGESLKNTKVTIYKDMYSEDSHAITLENVLERIKSGEKSGETIRSIRQLSDKEDQDNLKKKLPCYCFTGVIPKGKRLDTRVEQFSNLVILDYDKLSVDEMDERKEFFMNQYYTVAIFVSPRGNGLKILVHIKDGSRHREFYKAILQEFKGLDVSNINPSRLCFESYDKDIYINYNATTYNKFAITTERVTYQAKDVSLTDEDKFQKLSIWMQNKNEHFASGNRNIYIYKLAGACCRFGIDSYTAKELIRQEYLSTDSEFKVSEMEKAVDSAYKQNKLFSAEFDDKTFVDKTTKQEVVIMEDDDFVVDVIYGADVLEDALKIYRYGYESAESTGIDEVDTLFKWKKGELTILTGIGNHGKSTWWAFLMMQKSALDGTKWALFSPESYPAHEFYHSLVEMAMCSPLTPQKIFKPNEESYILVYNWIAEHFYFVYPKEKTPTPEYIKSRFLELIIKHKVSGCVIDPFNQMTNDYGGRDDKYLESFLGDISRFAMMNNVFMSIIAHPNKLRKLENGEYECPNVFDLAGGAMWNNKSDNILVYYRPNRNENPQDTLCQFFSKKIRRQNIVGTIGSMDMHYIYQDRTFEFKDTPIKRLLSKNQLIKEQTKFTV